MGEKKYNYMRYFDAILVLFSPNWNGGYHSANNRKFRYRLNVWKVRYYNGKQTSSGIYIYYQLLPFANLELSYNINKIDLNSLRKETFHLTRCFTGEVFFNNRLNWTTYIQYNRIDKEMILM